jgi:hypothetical protein
MLEHKNNNNNGKRENIMKLLICFFILFFILVWHASSYAGELEKINKMNKVYSDESRCLVAPEIRGEKDNSVSCFCRDAIMDARYVYESYLLTGKDRNLNGVYLTLVDHARQMCGEKYNVYNATQTKGWEWDGPQVTREYPPERDLLKIKPDSKGFRTVEYKVHLIYLDKGGRVIKVDNFTALEKLPPEPKK